MPHATAWSPRVYFGILRRCSADVFENQFCHFEHRDLIAAPEDVLQLLVGVDAGPIAFVLKFVLPDIVPEFPSHFSSWHRFIADDCRQLFIRLDWFHKGLARFALALGVSSFRHK